MVDRRILIALTGALLIAGVSFVLWPRSVWTPEEIATLRGMWLGSLPPLPPDPSNTVADDPRAVLLGQRLFFDTRLSVDGTVACATCHAPERQFQDGTPLGQGVGTTSRRTMPLAGVAYSPWLFWDGRKDSLWAQALGPLESAVEHGGSRTQYAHLLAKLTRSVIAQHYRAEYEALFGPLPDLSDPARFPERAGPVDDPAARAAWEGMAPEDREGVSRVFANIGKAIAAYERGILPGPSRFDAYVEALLRADRPAEAAALTADEIAGLRLFIGRGQCINCHNGPLLTNNDFHNTGVPAVPGLPSDRGRAQGIEEALMDAFNCLGPFSDAEPAACGELRFARTDAHGLERQFKVPSLRNVAERAPYMHAGQFASLPEVLAHYNRAPGEHTVLRPLGLSARELTQLEAFLGALSGPVSSPPEPVPITTCASCHPPRSAPLSARLLAQGQ